MDRAVALLAVSLKSRVTSIAVLLSFLLVVQSCKRSEPGGTDGAATQPSRPLNVAAAADLKFALDDVAKEYRARHPNVDLEITYGSSGNFYSQLVNKAPFDLFLSADVGYVDKLIEAGLGDKSSRFDYGTGQIVLWVPNESKLDITRGGLKSLADPSVKKLAIANPQHAPYGRAAQAALKAEGVWEPVQGKLVLGENIAQTAQFVQSGSVDAGIIAMSLAMSPGMKQAGRYIAIPQSDYPLLEQAGVVLSSAQDPAAARAFGEFLVGPEGGRILASYGFGKPK
jgi:molybdate transport system substrate-binding protein